ncbi:MAG TPA: hypothetical protein VIL24_05030 [Clostridia bacterium]
MKKFLCLILVVTLCASLLGCAKIEYVFTENTDESLSQQYNIYLDENYLESHGYSVDMMRRFLFKFFALYWDVKLTDTQLNNESVLLYGGQNNSIKYVFKLNYDEKILTFAIVFKNAQTYYDYYGITEDSNREAYEVKKGFFFYKIIQRVESPFITVKQAWNELYDKTLDDTSIKADFATAFMLGIKDSAGNVIFRGFRETFPDIPKEDGEKIIYRFAVSYARSKLQNTAHKTSQVGTKTYYIWEYDSENLETDKEITIITLKPNRAGWNILALGLTAAFAGILVLIAYIKKKNEPMKIEKIPSPPKPPPSIFGDQY